ncbi:MAG TPA: penicillin-binding transpeptidase domain-containing protein [Acidimicrobiales bacterium]|nr:penicillin-binding transpeptidase domain-containing protein [Acidimicrobiales bacterium]
MNRQIRRLGVALLLAFGALFLMMNYVQVVEASRLAHNPNNPRQVIADFNRPRGDIISADGVVVAHSVPTKDDLKFLRQYPTGALFGQITGFDSFIYGVQDGVEQTYNAQLSGHSLPIHSLSQILSNRVSTGTVVLTVSNKVQQAAQKALGNLAGSVVVIDPSTGGLMALYSNPSYDPSGLASHDTNQERSAWTLFQLNPVQPMLPRAYRRTYPPGSTFKLVTSAAVLDRDPSLAGKNYPVTGQISLPLTTNKLHNFANETCGGQLPHLLQVSCDTGFGQIGLDLGPDNLAGEASAFGFNQRPPFDLPAPARSSFPSASFFQRNLPLLAYSAIGQSDVRATTLQMALVGETIADAGTTLAPHVMAEIRDSQGNVVQRYNPHAWLHPTSTATAASLTQMMQLVTSPGGTAADLAQLNVPVAAKTGTAQTGVNTTDDWMVAFAPANAPRVVVAVTVPDQPPSATGDAVAGPITRAVLAAALGGP